MKNVTITLREHVARWARVKAAEQDISLSRFVGELLAAQMTRETETEAAMKDFLASPPLPLREEGAPLPTREELYDRPVLRRHQRVRLRERPD